MKNREKELSQRYYVAEATIWILSAILLVSHFFGLAPDQELPILDVKTSNPQHFLIIVAALLLAAILYMVVEWKQSSRVARDSILQGVRITVTMMVAIASLWIAYPIIAQQTRFSKISPAWYLGFVIIGFLLGTFTAILAFAALMIRTPQESKRLQLPRIPVPTGAQFISWIPLILISLIVYYILLFRSPPILYLIAPACVLVPMLIVLAEAWVSLFRSRDDNGELIPYSQKIAQLEKAHNFLDYSYVLNDEGNLKSVEKNLGLNFNEKPQNIQRAMQSIFSPENNRKSIGFHVEQLEELQIQFYPKDGISENSDPTNCGIKVRASRGKKEQVRVLVIPDDTNFPKREVEIPCSAIEQHAEKYLGEHPAQKQRNFHKAFSHAINTTVLEVLSEDGVTLHRLVESGQEDAVAEAIKNQADVNERAEAGWTPLLMACAQGYPKIARLLLRAGANPDLGNVRGFTPLIFGVNYSNVEICKLLLEYEVTVDYQDPYGETALMRAAGNGQSEIVQLLLDAGANPTITTRKGKTAVDFAYKHGHGEVAKILKKANKRTHSITGSASSE